MNQELRCSKRFHAAAENRGTIIEIHCRHHSYKEPGRVVKVYHRWKLVSGVWVAQPDRRVVIMKGDERG